MRRRFVVFALPRTGSTTLMRVLNLHPGIDCVNEPFNEQNFGGRIRARVRDAATLDAELAEIWAAHNGIKHAWNPSGWPFAEMKELNTKVMTAGDAVVMLTRRNVLRRAVSIQLSMQSEIWFIGDDGQRNRYRSHRFSPLDRDWIRYQLESERSAVEEQQRLLRSSGVEHLALEYEDLYECPDAAERLRNWERVLRFVVGPGQDGTITPEMRDVIESREERQNSPATYRDVPEIDEIEFAFGSAETGWLFR